MCRTIYHITALLLTGVLPAAATLDPPPVGPFNNGYGDYSVLAAESGETSCQYSATLPGRDEFLDAAAKILNGRRKSRGNITGRAHQFKTVGNTSKVAKISGAGVGGQYRYTFPTREEAVVMQNLMHTFQLYMDPGFDCTTGTVGMPLPVTLTIDGVEFRADGGSPTCTFSYIPVGDANFESYKVFLRSAAKVYCAVQINGLNNDIHGDATSNVQQFGPNDNDLYTAKYGGEGIGGAYKFLFMKETEAIAFRDFLDFFKRYFNPDFDCSGGNGFWVMIPPPSCILGCEVYAPAEFLPLRHITNLTDYDDVLDIPGCRTYSCCCFAEQNGNIWEQDQCACAAEIAEVV